MKNLHRITLLIDTYKNLLTEKQLSYLEKYFFEDLSLSEISQIYNISRSAVLCLIKRSVNELEKYESKLKLIYKKEQRLLLYKKILDEDLRNKLIKLEDN